MKTFKSHLVEEDINTILEFASIADDDLFEKIDIAGSLKKAGLAVDKHVGGKGLIQILKGVSVHIAQIFITAIKASIGKKSEAKAELKKLLSRKVRREEVVDVLLRLDQLSLHLFTGPIHMIDALTGWELAADIHGAGKDVGGRVKTAIKSLDTVKKEIGGSRVKRLDNILKELKRMFSV